MRRACGAGWPAGSCGGAWRGTWGGGRWTGMPPGGGPLGRAAAGPSTAAGGSVGMAGPMGTAGSTGMAGSMGMAAGSMAGTAGTGPVGAMGTAGGSWAASAGVVAPPGAGSAGSIDDLDGAGFLSSTFLSGDVLAGSAFTLNHETGPGGGVLSVWSRGARSRFAGRAGRLGLRGDVSTALAGADYARGPLVAGLSLARSWGLGDYRGASKGGRVRSAVTGLYPWLGYRLTERVTVWGVTGYGAGAMRLTPGSGADLEAGLAMAMAAAGTRGELIAGGAGGFGLAFKADALWVGTSSDGVEGPAGNLAETRSAVSRLRTGLEGSRSYLLAGRTSLKPSVEVGLRHDGGDAETGAGLDVGGGLSVSDSSSGLAVEVRVRTLVVHQAAGFRERGAALSLSWNPTPSTPLGLVARVTPSWGGQATGGAQALWGRDTMAGMAEGGALAGSRLEAELGYGLPVGSRLVGTPRFGVGASEHGRDYRLGYGLTLFERGDTSFDVGVDARRRESPSRGGTEGGVLGRLTAQW